MSPAEITIARALGACTFLPASWDKRFARDMASIAQHSPEKEFTDRQAAHLLRLCHKYRRQIPARVLEMVLDEMERRADARAAAGLPALPDFRKASRPTKPKSPEAELPLLAARERP